MNNENNVYMKISTIFVRTSCQIILILSLCSGCSTLKDSSNEDLALGTVLGAIVGAGIGYSIDGKEGAAIGAVVGAGAGAAMVVVINKDNKKQIQEALNSDHPTVFRDKKTGQRIKVVPAIKYENSDKLSCIDFGIQNLDEQTIKLGNSACKINGQYEFVVSANNILIEPVINHVAPFPIPEPNPRPKVN